MTHTDTHDCFLTSPGAPARQGSFPPGLLQGTPRTARPGSTRAMARMCRALAMTAAVCAVTGALWCGVCRAQQELLLQDPAGETVAVQGVVPAARDVQAAAADQAPADTPDSAGLSLFQMVRKGGIVGYLIILLSFIATALVIDYALTIRKSRLTPARDIVVLKKLIQERRLEEISRLDQEKSSFLSQVVIAGLKESGFGYQSMIKAMEDVSEAISARIARKIEHLNVIGNIAPMMGLLGTVIGMLRCFNEISRVTGAIEPRQLAGGIFEALVTTCMGLIVAIPSLYFYALFRNRVDEFTGEAAMVAEELVNTFKTDGNGD